MLRLLLAFAIALASPVPAAFAQPQGDAAAALDEADALIDELQSEGLIESSGEKGAIRAEVKRQLNRIAQGRSFSSIRRSLEAQIKAAPDLTSDVKDEALTILGDFANQGISQEKAASALKQLRARPRPASASGPSGGFMLTQYATGFVLILVLFILLVIIVSGFGSDRRLKRDIRLLATRADGLRLYAFRYRWSGTEYVGVIAQDLLADPRWRDAAIMTPFGFYVVDYARLGMRMTTLDAWLADGPDAEPAAKRAA